MSDDALARPSLDAGQDCVLAEPPLRPLYQPVADLFHGRVHGYESLPLGPAPGMPAGSRLERELACLHAGLAGFADDGKRSKLFLNLSSGVLLECWQRWGNGMIARLLEGSRLAPEDLVLELTPEHEPGPDGGEPPGLRHALESLRGHGMRVALDGYGTGRASLRLWAELRPDVIKIDRYFFQDIAGNAPRQQLVRALMSTAQALGAIILAEGIETSEDLATVRDLGIRYAQGRELGEPAAELARVLPEPVQALLHLRRAAQPPTDSPYGTVRGLRVEAPAVRRDRQTNDDVHKLFLEHPDLHAVAVLDERDHPIGLVNRRGFSEQYAIRYTRELFGNKPCMTFMSAEPLMVDENTAIDRLSPVLISEDQRYLRDGFILTRNGQYSGLGTGEALVRAVTELRLEAARYANPLTALPGNIPISRQIGQLLEGEEGFIVCYGDMDNFKPFNDVYGYWRGDDMIQLCAEALKRHCDPLRDFVGHVGGDDFVMLLRSDDWSPRLERLISEFNERARGLYDEAGRRNGGIEAEDRHGVRRFFPFVTLGVGALRVNPASSRGTRPQDIASAAAGIKHRVKHSHSSLIVDDYTSPSN